MKNRNRKVDHGPLFDRPYDPELDALESYNDCVRAIGEQHRAGRPLPESMLSRNRATDGSQPGEAASQNTDAYPNNQRFTP